MKRGIFFYVLIALALLALAGLIWALSPGKTPDTPVVVLSLPPAPDSSAAPSGEDPARDTVIDITTETVQTAISTLRRAEGYSRRLTVQSFWNGGSSTTEIDAHIRGENARLMVREGGAPSAEVKNILIKDCYMSVNDDAIAMKGGKGPYADSFKNSYEGIDLKDFPEIDGDGGNENVIIEDCEYGFCHGCLTLGSESVYNRNIILRRIKVNEASNLLWLKMRPDTPQLYEYVTVEDIEGNGKNFLLVAPWTQFYDLKGREDMPMSYSDNITMKNIKFDCNSFFNVKNREDQYHLSNFTFENLDVNAETGELHPEYVENFTIRNVKVNGIEF